MKTLYEKIRLIHTSLVESDFAPSVGTIQLQNDLDERGDYIAKWEHPTLAQPTKEQLDGISS